jgi:hypothetical protein
VKHETLTESRAVVPHLVLVMAVLDAILYVRCDEAGNSAGKSALSKRSSSSGVSSVGWVDHDLAPVAALLHVAMGVARLL